MWYRSFNMERGIWANELDAFFLFMAYLSFAYMFSFLITCVVEMPCLNCYQTFILGDNKQQVVYRGNAIKRASSTSDESDAETLDKNVDADKDLFVSPSINGSNKAYQQASKLLSN